MAMTTIRRRRGGWRLGPAGGYVFFRGCFFQISQGFFSEIYSQPRREQASKQASKPASQQASKQSGADSSTGSYYSKPANQTTKPAAVNQQTKLSNTMPQRQNCQNATTLRLGSMGGWYDPWSLQVVKNCRLTEISKECRERSTCQRNRLDSPFSLGAGCSQHIMSDIRVSNWNHEH